MLVKNVEKYFYFIETLTNLVSSESAGKVVWVFMDGL